LALGGEFPVDPLNNHPYTHGILLLRHFMLPLGKPFWQEVYDQATVVRLFEQPRFGTRPARALYCASVRDIPDGLRNTDIVDADHLVEGDKVSFNIASDLRTGKSRAATVTVIQ
jgi:hypothetical protein